MSAEKPNVARKLFEGLARDAGHGKVTAWVNGWPTFERGEVSWAEVQRLMAACFGGGARGRGRRKGGRVGRGNE